MQLTTHNIIKMLPFDEALKKQLLEKYDVLDVDQKYNLEQVVWATYYMLFDLKLEENIQIAEAEAEEKGKELEAEEYKQIRAQTEQAMMAQEAQLIQSADLTQTREKLATLLTNPQPAT